MKWRSWIRPGLAVAVLLAVVALVLEHGAVEADLIGRGKALLTVEGQDWAVLTASGRDMTIIGTAPDNESRQVAIRAVGSLAGIRTVTDAARLLPLATPFAWSARRDGSTVVLAGFVPSESARASVMASARRELPAVEIRDAMDLARGAPAAFDAATAFALARLGELATGLVMISDATLAISGVAIDAAGFAAGQLALAEAIPPGVTLGTIDVLPPRADRFVWSLNFDGTSVIASGFVPSEMMRETLAATVRSTLGDLPVVDGLTVASGGPPGFSEAAAFAIDLVAHLRSGGVTLDGLDLDVAGEARSVDDYAALRSTLDGPLPAGISLVAEAIVPAPASPYGWQGEITDGRVVLTGYVPTPALRVELAALVDGLFRGRAIDYRLKVASGEPRMDWIGAVKFGLEQLSRLAEGTVTLVETEYSIKGQAGDPDAYMAILDANSRTLPASLELAMAEVTAPSVSPYRFVAERRGERLVLTGFVPEAAHETILAVASRGFGSDVLDELKFAGGAPAGFLEAAANAVRAAGRMAGGRVEIVDQSVSIHGTAYNEAAAAGIAGLFPSAMPEPFAVASASVIAAQPGQPVGSEHCREMLLAALEGSIDYEDDDTAIAADSFGVLDRVSSVIARCPDAHIEIGAHSDSTGSAASNLARTQARADAIADFIVGAGVRRERLSPIGHGELQPVADNNTDEGRAANRRVEFALILPDGR